MSILTKPKNAICKQYMKYLELDGVKLVFEDEAIEEIAESLLKENRCKRIKIYNRKYYA